LKGIIHRKHELRLFPNVDGFVDQTNWVNTLTYKRTRSK